MHDEVALMLPDYKLHGHRAEVSPLDHRDEQCFELPRSCEKEVHVRSALFAGEILGPDQLAPRQH